MHSIVLQDTLTLLEVVEGVTLQGGLVGATRMKTYALYQHTLTCMTYYACIFSPERNVINIIFPVAISGDRPKAELKFAVTLTK